MIEYTYPSIVMKQVMFKWAVVGRYRGAPPVTGDESGPNVEAIAATAATAIRRGPRRGRNLPHCTQLTRSTELPESYLTDRLGNNARTAMNYFPSLDS